MELGGQQGDELPVVEGLVLTLYVVCVNFSQREGKLRQVVQRTARILR